MIPAAALVVPAVSALIGWQIAGLAVRRGRRDLVLRLVLAPGLGLGASSLALFATLVLAGPRPSVFLAVEFAMVAALAFVLRRRRSPARDEEVPAAAPDAGESRWVTAALAAALVAAVGVSAFSFSEHVARAPHGGWDGWAIWNLKARFLATPGDDWTRVFSDVIKWSHPDYPLLLPCAVAQVWISTGVQSMEVPAWIAAAFTFSTVMLLVAGLALSRGLRQGLLAGLVLLAARGYMNHGATMYADVPLSFFMLATLVALVLHDMRRDASWLVLAGTAASMAAWTKNEGVPFLLVTACAVVFSCTRKARRPSAPRDLAGFGAGAAPAIACLVVLKIRFAATNDLIAAARAGAGTVSVWDLACHREMAAGFLHEAASCFGIRFGLLAWLVLAAHATVAAIGARSLRAAEVLCAAIVLGTFATYYVVILASCDDPGGLVRGSIDRLSYQLAPSVILLFFLPGRPREPAAVRGSDGPGA